MLCLLQTIDELIGFEDDLMSLIKNIEFCNGSNTFQQHLSIKLSFAIIRILQKSL